MGAVGYSTKHYCTVEAELELEDPDPMIESVECTDMYGVVTDAELFSANLRRVYPNLKNLKMELCYNEYIELLPHTRWIQNVEMSLMNVDDNMWRLGSIGN